MHTRSALQYHSQREFDVIDAAVELENTHGHGLPVTCGIWARNALYSKDVYEQVEQWFSAASLKMVTWGRL
jgi:hypothetical protein